MAWESNDMLSFIDINADPFIHEVIKIPQQELNEEADVNEKAEVKLSYEVASATVPFLDSTSYLKMSSDKLYERQIGVSNFFKTQQKMEINDSMGRLKRKHRNLRSAWYLKEFEQSIEHHV